MTPSMASAIAIRRAEAGISRRELARRAGTSAATLAKYEHGTVSPGLETFERIMASALPRRRRWASLGELAVAVADALSSGDVSWAWRICTEVIDDEHGSSAEETALFAGRYPQPTGNSWADAMVAAFGEWVCIQKGITPPMWTLEPRVAAPFWFVRTLPTFRVLAFAESPPSFASRGIFLSRSDLFTA